MYDVCMYILHFPTAVNHTVIVIKISEPNPLFKPTEINKLFMKDLPR